MYFLVQIHRSIEEVYTKGVVVKDTLEAARQGFHAYLGAYGYGNNANIDYVQCMVIDDTGRVRDSAVDNRIVVPVPEPETTPIDPEDEIVLNEEGA